MNARRKTAALIAVAALAVTACGGDDDDANGGDAGGDDTAADTAAPPDETAEPTADAGGDDTGGDAGGDTGGDAGGDTGGDAGGDTGGGVEALYQECLDESARVNLIALPDEWANYGGILAAFGEKFPGVDYPVQNPNASSQEEIDAVVNLAGQPDMPDVLDVGPAIASVAKAEGLWEPYVTTVDAEIPDNLKDPDDMWFGAYYGIMAIGTNTTIVPNAPQTWADLKKPEYEGKVALNGDPRSAGAAFAAVMAASLANGGSPDDILPGIEYFAELKSIGNLIPTEVTQATVISGETPIALDWSYNYPGLAKQIEDAGYTVEIHFPADGVYGGYYAQGLVKDSPNQACGKLWLEHILSDEGQLGYLQGGAMPARFTALEAAGKIAEEDLANLPPPELIEQISFLTTEQVEAANAVLQENWGPMVADL